MPGKMLFGRGKRREEQDDESDKEERIEQLQVQFKASSDGKFETCDDVYLEHFPSKEEIAEELGGGVWRVYGRDANGRIVKQRKYNITDREVTYPIVGYKIKVKKDMKGKWYNTDLEYAHKPSEEEIETDIGGGGIVKIYGIDKDGKMVNQDVVKIDAEPPEWLVESEDEVQKSLKEKLAERRKEEDEKLLKKLEGDEDDGGDADRVSKAINKLVNSFEEMQLDKFESIVSQLTEGKQNNEQPKELSFSDVMFKQPQMKKLEAITTVVQELAQEDPHEAAKLLDKIPDASGAFVNLITAGGEALSSFSKAMTAHAKEKEKAMEGSEESSGKKKEKTEKKKTGKEKEKTEKKEEKEEKEEEEKKEPEEGTGEHTEPEETQESEPINIEVEERDTGFDISLGLDEIIEGEEE